MTAEKEYLLGNKAKDLYLYTRQVTKHKADDKVEAKDVAMVMRKIAISNSLEDMRSILSAIADRLEHKKKRPGFPKSETFGMIKDLRDGARAIVLGVYAANETKFNEHPEDRLHEIKTVIDQSNLMLQLIEMSHDLGYIDTKRMSTWSKKVLDVKYMCLAWLKKDSARAKEIARNTQRLECENLVLLVREILEQEKNQ